MDANELFFYLRGFAETVDYPNPSQWGQLRNEILRAEPAKGIPYPVPMVNPIPGSPPCGGCK